MSLATKNAGVAPKAFPRARCCPVCYLSLALLATASTLKADTFRAALVAKTNLTIRNVLVDSFDSSDPHYSTNGDYDPSKHRTGGNIVVTEPDTLLILQTSAFVFGKAYVGPNGAALLITNSSLGSTIWIDAGNLGIEPGWFVLHPGGFVFDTPMVPFTNGLSLPGKGTHVLMGTNYTSSYLLTSGDYLHTNLTLGSSEKLLVQGDVRIYFAGSFRMFGQSQVRIATNSSLTVYAATNIDLLGGGVINHTRFASNLTFYGLDTCTSIQYDGGADFIGTFYAPTAAFTASGGSTVYHLVGSVTASCIEIAGNYQIHLDEALPSSLIYPNAAATLSRPVITENGKFQFEVTGLPGHLYAIQASTNLTNWSTVAINSSPFVFTTNVALFFPQKFFRAVHSY